MNGPLSLTVKSDNNGSPFWSDFWKRKNMVMRWLVLSITKIGNHTLSNLLILTNVSKTFEKNTISIVVWMKERSNSELFLSRWIDDHDSLFIWKQEISLSSIKEQWNVFVKINLIWGLWFWLLWFWYLHKRDAELVRKFMRLTLVCIMRFSLYKIQFE